MVFRATLDFRVALYFRLALDCNLTTDYRLTLCCKVSLKWRTALDYSRVTLNYWVIFNFRVTGDLGLLDGSLML